MMMMMTDGMTEDDDGDAFALYTCQRQSWTGVVGKTLKESRLLLGSIQ